MSYSVETFAKLKNYYKDPESVQLSDHEELILKRWETAFIFLRDLKTVSETVEMLKRKFPDVSTRTLYRDIDGAFIMFGNAVEANKQAKRFIANEYIIDYLNRCKASGDRDNEKAAIKLYMDNNNLKKEDEEDYDPEKMFVNPKIEIPENLLSGLINFLNQGAINLMDEKNKVLTIDVNAEVQQAPIAIGNGATT